MHARGYSLVEMVVVVCVVSILLAIGTLRFNEFSKRYQTESQTRMIFTALLNARANAVYQRRPTRVKLYPNLFEVYSSATDGVVPIVSQPLKYPITYNAGSHVDFDVKGMTANLCSICVDESDGTGAVDSIVVHYIKLSIGKKDKGDACNAPNITIK